MNKLGNYIITKAKEEKDLEVVIQDDLFPEKHINIIRSRILIQSYNLLMIVISALTYLEEDMI